jgi:hypothetical protein
MTSFVSSTSCGPTAARGDRTDRATHFGLVGSRSVRNRRTRQLPHRAPVAFFVLLVVVKLN